MEISSIEVVSADSLPKKFRPPERDGLVVKDLSAPAAKVAKKAVEDLSEEERQSFLSHLKRSQPGLFKNRTSGDGKPSRPQGEGTADPSGTDHSEEEARTLLTEELKKQANQFMAAAAKI